MEGYIMYKVKKKETFIPSSNGKDKLHVIVWEPQGEIRAILQISHGMIELIDRYDEFARYLAAKGFVVAGNDHLGHGLTAANMDELGYMNAYDASKAIVADLHRVTRSLKKAYKGVPFFLMGHSMGSFMARRYMSDYGWDPKYPSPYTEGSSVDGFICMGTGSMLSICCRSEDLCWSLRRVSTARDTEVPSWKCWHLEHTTGVSRRPLSWTVR